MKRHIGNREETFRTVMGEEPSGAFVRAEKLQLIPAGNREQGKTVAQLNPVLLRAKTLVVYPIPPACYPSDRNPRSLKAES